MPAVSTFGSAFAYERAPNLLPRRAVLPRRLSASWDFVSLHVPDFLPTSSPRRSHCRKGQGERKVEYEREGGGGGGPQ